MTTFVRAMRVIASVVALVAAACGGKMPETRYYQLASPARAEAGGDAVVVIEPLSTDAAYDDERMVYRTSPYRVDYYQYHRWVSSPGTMVSDYLAQSLAHTGRFRAIARELSESAAVVLGGRVIAIEEVDERKDRWLGRVSIELTLTDAKSGAVLWSQQFDETEPLPSQTPEGLAAALSSAMGRIVARAAPPIAELADRQARLRVEKTPMANRVPAPAR